MTSQEMQVLEHFLSQLVQARAVGKDVQAEAAIANAVARQPDAAYLLVQRALLLEQALDTAKAQIAALQEHARKGGSDAGGFLNPANAWGRSASVPATAPTPVYAPAQPAAYGAAPVVPSRPGFFGGGMGGALGTIASTAAGVAAGAFLYQGIESLLHHGGGQHFLGQPLAGDTGMGGEAVPLADDPAAHAMGDRLGPGGEAFEGDSLLGNGGTDDNLFVDSSDADYSEDFGGDDTTAV